MPSSTSIPNPTATATETQVPASENLQYNTIDINHPFETCPVITDIGAYFEWLQNSPIELFGPNAVLRPLGTGDWNGSDPINAVEFNPNTDKNYKDPSTWSFRQSPNIVCYNSGQLKYLLFPIAWLNPADRNKPFWTLSGFIYDYSYGVKPTDKGLTQVIKGLLSNRPSFFIAVGPGESFGSGNQSDYLEVKTANSHPDIKERMREFINTGNASSVSAPDIILDPWIIY